MKTGTRETICAAVTTLFLVAVLFLLPSHTTQASHTTFAIGDVFVARADGKVEWRHPDGTLNRVLDTGQSNAGGMAFDAAGNLYATNFSDNNVTKFDTSGNRVGTFGSGYDCNPESILFDQNGDAYVGQAGPQTPGECNRAILKFSSSGALLKSFTPAIENRGTDWIELALDQCTMFYTSEGKRIKRFNVCSNTQLPDFATELPGSNAFGLRFLPSSGLIVADSEIILRLSNFGTNVQEYDAPNEDSWFAVNLDPDGKSFWSAGILSGNVYKFDIATGAVLLNFPVSGFPSEVDEKVPGLAVFGEITGSQPCTIICPANVTRSNTPGQCGATVNYPDPTANSPCSRITCTPSSGTVFPVGTTTVTCTEVIQPGATVASARDDATSVEIMAAAICRFTVTVADTQPPTVVCPTQPIVIDAGNECTALMPDLRSRVTATDNCPGTLSFTQSILAGASLSVGSRTVTVTVRDPAGNSTNCPVTVTVTSLRSAAPVITPGFVNLGTVKLTAAVKKKKKVRATVATGTFTIQNPGCSALTLTLSGIRRVTDQDKFKAPPDDTGFFSIFSQGSEGQGLVGSQVTIGPNETRSFVVRFAPSVPRVRPCTNSSCLSPSDAAPDNLVSELFFAEISQTVRFRTGVDIGVKLIDPVNPANSNPVVTLCRSGDQFTVTYHIYDSNKTDVKTVTYEFLDGSGNVIKLIEGVNLAAPISNTGLVNGQSFNVEQTFSGAKDNDNGTQVRVTVRGGGSNSSGESSGSSGCTASAQALWKTKVTTVVMPPRRLKRAVR